MAQHQVHRVMLLRSAHTDEGLVSDLRTWNTIALSGDGLAHRHGRGAISARHRPVQHHIYGEFHSIGQAYLLALSSSFEIARARRYTNPDTTPPGDRPCTGQRRIGLLRNLPR